MRCCTGRWRPLCSDRVPADRPSLSNKIIRIVALLRATVARYRFGRPAALAVALYLTAAALAAAYDGGRWFAAVATAGFWPWDDGARLLPAAVGVLVLPMAVVGAEADARLTYTAADEGCRARLRPAAGLEPEERRRWFLCLARGETFAADAMFPEDLADQRVLAYGAQLCALPGNRERSALHERVGGTADALELAAALEYLCPGIVARRNADAAASDSVTSVIEYSAGSATVAQPGRTPPTPTS